MSITNTFIRDRILSTHLLVICLALGLILGLLVSDTASAQAGGDYDVEIHVFSSGGEDSLSGGDYQVGFTLAQNPDPLALSGGDYQVVQGYWQSPSTGVQPGDLRIAKTAEPVLNVSYQSLVTYTISLSNVGQYPAAGTVLTDTLPSQVSFARWITQNGAALVGEEIRWSGTVPGDDELVWSWAVTHTGGYGDVVTNTAVFSQPVAGGGTASAAFTVKDAPQISITKTVTPHVAVDVHAPVTYTLSISNSQPSDAFNTLLTDTLPSQVTFARWITQNSAALVGEEIRWSGTVPGDDELVWSWVVTYTGGHNQVVTNTACFSQTLVGSGSSSATFRSVGDNDPVGYMPYVVKDYALAPDLVIKSLNIKQDSIEVVIQNQGQALVDDAFWVDVYFDPTHPPLLNQPWPTIAPYGAAWGLTTDIPAGESLTLTTGDQYYVAEFCSQPPYPIRANVYAFVDSVDFSTTYGVLWESNEDNNRFGPVVSTQGQSLGNAPDVRTGASPGEGLPER